MEETALTDELRSGKARDFASYISMSFPIQSDLCIESDTFRRNTADLNKPSLDGSNYIPSIVGMSNGKSLISTY